MRICFFLSLAFAITAFAADDDKINVQLDAVRLSELVKIGYAEVLNTGYIADDAFITDPRSVTFRIASMSKEELKISVNHLLDLYGYKLEHVGKTIFISKKSEGPERAGDKRPFYYQPRYRSVRYISDLVSSIFTSGRFTFQRQVQSPAGKNALANESAGATSSTSSAPNTSAMDTGTNAISQIAKDSDAFIFYGTEKEIDQLQALLVQIDRPQGEVVVKAIIYEVTNSENKQTAFNAAVNLLTSKLSLNINASSLANTLSLKVPGIEAIISALSTDSRFKVISSPTLRVKDRETAKFSVGSDVPVLGAVSYQNNGQAVQSVNYQSSGVILDISPVIRSDTIDLDIRQQLSNFVATSSGVNNSPTLIKREIQTTVSAHDGDVILLAGLEETKATDTSTGFSFLPRILSGNTKEHSQSDILLFIQLQRLN